MAAPLSGENEWIEIYNNSSDSVDLTGWTIQEKTSSGNFTSHPLSSASIPGSGYYIYEFSSSKLNNDQDTINLLNPQGTTVDTFIYTNTSSNLTFARIPDGGGEWILNALSTKGTTNGNSPTSSPSLTPTPSPTLTPSPSPTSIPSPTSTSTPAPTPSSSFIIFNLPAKINSNQSFSVKVNLSLPNNPNSQIYLKGAFKKEGGSNYFGLTKVGNEWIKNGSSFKNQLSIKTDSSGNWNGEVDIKVDTGDSGFTGSSDYLFKVGRYFQDSSSVSWSNETNIYIDNKTASGDSIESFENQEDEEVIDDNSSEKTSLSSKTNLYKIDAATIAGVSIEDNSKDISETSVRTDKRHNPVLIILGVGLILVSGVLLFYNRFKDRIRFPSW